MRGLILGLMVFTLSLSVFALDEMVTLEFLLKDSVTFFKQKKTEVTKKINGLQAIGELEGLTNENKLALDKLVTMQSCRKNAYEMLFKIARSYEEKNAFYSAFLTRRNLNLKGDELISLYDFFIRPYLEYLSYKTESLTAQANGSRFLSNEEMPFFIEEINVDGYCQNQANLKHYGENGDYTELSLELPKRIKINDVKRSKQKYIEAQVEKVKEFSRSKSK